jgi:PhzF family phenazine biosynthesis protein
MTTRSRRFVQCDVFSPFPTEGNGLAVVIDAEGLSTEEMQRFAAWTNLAETTFLLPPKHRDADYRVRIFTTVREMPFAGHPTLGSCASWLHCGGAPKISGLVKQQCEVGIIDIDLTGTEPAFVAPPTAIAAMDRERFETICQTLDLAPEAVFFSAQLDNGPVWQALHLASAADVLRVESARVRWPTFQAIGLIGAHPPGSECDYEVRMLAPSSGMSEDPITGSLNAALAHWMRSEGRLQAPVTIAQGTCINRHGRVSIRPDAQGRILIGGQTHILIDGFVTL